MDSCTRLLFIFLNIWRGTVSNNVNQCAPKVQVQSTIPVKDSGFGQSQPTQTVSTINSSSSGNSSINSSGISSITLATTVNVAEQTKKTEQVNAIFKFNQIKINTISKFFFFARSLYQRQCFSLKHLH